LTAYRGKRKKLIKGEVRAQCSRKEGGGGKGGKGVIKKTNLGKDLDDYGEMKNMTVGAQPVSIAIKGPVEKWRVTGGIMRTCRYAGRKREMRDSFGGKGI